MFDGETVSDTLAQVLTKEPDWEQVPVKVRRLLRRCLEKDPKKRLRDIGDALELLEEEQATAPSRSRLVWMVATAAFAVTASALGWIHFRQPAPDERVLRLQIDPPEGGEFRYGATIGGLALSPDGRTVAYVASSNGKSQLWVRPLDETAARVIPASEDAGFPFWSPDSKSIAFSVRGVKLQRVDLAGGASLTICETAVVFRGGAWTSDGQIIFGTLGAGLFRVPASGGTPSPLNSLGAWPQLLPGGRFLYFVLGDKPENNGAYAASLAKPSDAVKLLSTDTSVLYARGANGKGYLLWLRGSTLQAQEFDVTRLRLVGEPHPVADPVVGSLGMVNASVSSNGLLLYGAVSRLQQFTWVDRMGKKLATLGEPLAIGPYRLSPDGRRVAVVTGLGTDVWLMDVERGVASRFTFQGGIFPVWSPDGRTILYGHLIRGMFRRALNGSGGEQSLTQSPNLQLPTDWSQDGRFVLFYEVTKQNELWVLPLTPDGRPAAKDKARRYASGRFDTVEGRFYRALHSRKMRFLLLKGERRIKIMLDAKTHLEKIGEVIQSRHHFALQDLWVGETSGPELVDIVEREFGKSGPQLDGKVQESFVRL